MHIEKDGSLMLHARDLEGSYYDTMKPHVSWFTREAQIAVSYANQAGYKVSFVRPGEPIQTIVPSSSWNLLPVRPLGEDGWPLENEDKETDLKQDVASRLKKRINSEKQLYFSDQRNCGFLMDCLAGGAYDEGFAAGVNAVLEGIREEWGVDVNLEG